MVAWLSDMYSTHTRHTTTSSYCWLHTHTHSWFTKWKKTSWWVQCLDLLLLRQTSLQQQKHNATTITALELDYKNNKHEKINELKWNMIYWGHPKESNWPPLVPSHQISLSSPFFIKEERAARWDNPLKWKQHLIYSIVFVPVPCQYLALPYGITRHK